MLRVSLSHVIVSSDVALCRLVRTRTRWISTEPSANFDVVYLGPIQFGLSGVMFVHLRNIWISIKIALSVIVADVRPMLSFHGMSVKVRTRITSGILSFFPAGVQPMLSRRFNVVFI
jgi:hypothetical protein